MAHLDVSALAASMVAAMKQSLAGKWPAIRDYAEGEAAKLAHSLAQITTLRAAGTINDAECSVMLEMQKNATRAVLMAVAGITLLLAEAAINAALAVVKNAVNSAIGIALL